MMPLAGIDESAGMNGKFRYFGGVGTDPGSATDQGLGNVVGGNANLASQHLGRQELYMIGESAFMNF